METLFFQYLSQILSPFLNSLFQIGLAILIILYIFQIYSPASKKEDEIDELFNQPPTPFALLTMDEETLSEEEISSSSASDEEGVSDKKSSDNGSLK